MRPALRPVHAFRRKRACSDARRTPKARQAAIAAFARDAIIAVWHPKRAQATPLRVPEWPKPTLFAGVRALL